MGAILDIHTVYNEYTLNLFSDASISKGIGAYGAIAVCRDTEVERAIFTKNPTTVNEAELSGLRLSLMMATRYQNTFKYINIFSDSKLSIDIISSFKNHEYKLAGENKFGDPKYEIVRYVQSKRKYIPYENQIYIADCIWLYSELLKNTNIEVNLIHQPAHLFPNRFDTIHDIKKHTLDEYKIKYKINNYISSEDYIPSTEYLIYISKYNDAIDRSTRIALHEMSIRTDKRYYTTPIHFKPLCCAYPELL